MASIRVRVTAPRGTLVLVEVVEFDGAEPALPPPTIDTTGVEVPPSEPPPAAALPSLHLVRGRAA